MPEVHTAWLAGKVTRAFSLRVTRIFFYPGIFFYGYEFISYPSLNGLFAANFPIPDRGPGTISAASFRLKKPKAMANH